MKVKYVTANGRLTFELESDNEKKLFKDIAHLQEVFEVQACGCCKSDRIRYDVREFDKKLYYKLVCDACGAQLDFGQSLEGNTLFLRRRDKETKELLPNGGWYHYTGENAAPAPSTNHATKPAQKPAQAAQKPAQQRQATTPNIDKQHLLVIEAYKRAGDLKNLDEWVKWARGIDFPTHHVEEQSDVYREAKDRLERAMKWHRRTA